MNAPYDVISLDSIANKRLQPSDRRASLSLFHVTSKCIIIIISITSECQHISIDFNQIERVSNSWPGICKLSRWVLNINLSQSLLKFGLKWIFHVYIKTCWIDGVPNSIWTFDRRAKKKFARLKIWKSSIPSWNSDRYMSSNWLRWESSYNRAAFCASEFLLILFSIRKQTWTDWRVNMNLVVTVELVCSSEFRSVSFGYRRPYVLTGLSTYFGLQTQFYVCHFL